MIKLHLKKFKDKSYSSQAFFYLLKYASKYSKAYFSDQTIIYQYETCKDDSYYDYTIFSIRISDKYYISIYNEIKKLNKDLKKQRCKSIIYHYDQPFSNYEIIYKIIDYLEKDF